MEGDDLFPGVDETMAEYLKSDRYRKSSSGITFSDFEGQEEANYAFWRRLTPSQRIELHTIMVNSIYKDASNRNTGNQTFEIVFTDKSI
ncbi:MAG: hypothetical protein ACOYM0_07485 [Bacteroidales bacterium]